MFIIAELLLKLGQHHIMLMLILGRMDGREGDAEDVGHKRFPTSTKSSVHSLRRKKKEEVLTFVVDR